MRDGGLFNIVVKERLAERSGICDFLIALLEALVSGVKAKAVFPRFGLNDVSSSTAQFFILRQSVGYLALVGTFEHHRQCDAILDRLVGPLAEMRKHRM